MEKLQEAKELQQIQFNRTFTEINEKLSREAVNRKVLADIKLQQQIKQLKSNGSNKTSLISKRIESGRLTFMKMFQMQAEQQNAERKVSQDRWNREDRHKKPEMERLRLSNDIDFQRQKDKLAQL